MATDYAEKIMNAKTPDERKQWKRREQNNDNQKRRGAKAKADAALIVVLQAKIASLEAAAARVPNGRKAVDYIIELLQNVSDISSPDALRIMQILKASRKQLTFGEIVAAVEVVEPVEAVEPVDVVEAVEPAVEPVAASALKRGREAVDEADYDSDTTITDDETEEVRPEKKCRQGRSEDPPISWGLSMKAKLARKALLEKVNSHDHTSKDDAAAVEELRKTCYAAYKACWPALTDAEIDAIILGDA